MSTGAPVNDYAVNATLTVDTPVAATAQTKALTAVGDINAALATLDENVGFSAAEVEGTPQTAPVLALESVNAGQQHAVQAALLIGASDMGSAQQAGEDAVTAINTAIAGISPAVTVSVESEQGRFVFSQL